MARPEQIRRRTMHLLGDSLPGLWGFTKVVAGGEHPLQADKVCLVFEGASVLTGEAGRLQTFLQKSTGNKDSACPEGNEFTSIVLALLSSMPLDGA